MRYRMRQLVDIKANATEKRVKFHDAILEILFAHKNEIFRKFSDIKGLYFLDHVAITIFNPENEIVIFSLTPSVEYNVIIKELWKSDITFKPDEYADGSFAWWDDKANEYSEEIKRIKKENHHFSVGFNLYKKVDGFRFIYSFASRKKDEDMRLYYENIINELFLLGDYGYKLIRGIYLGYCGSHVPPQITEYTSAEEKPYLRLIVSNK